MLAIQRDTIQTAKLVASLDQVSGGRFILGIGGGWNVEEMEDHGTLCETRFKEIARADRSHEGDLGQTNCGIQRQDRQSSIDADLAQTSPEAAPRLSLVAPSATPPDRDLGVARMNVGLPPAKADRFCPCSTVGRN